MCRYYFSLTIDARADSALQGALPITPIFGSGDNDVDLANGYKTRACLILQLRL